MITFYSIFDVFDVDFIIQTHTHTHRIKNVLESLSNRELFFRVNIL